MKQRFGTHWAHFTLKSGVKDCEMLRTLVQVRGVKRPFVSYLINRPALGVQVPTFADDNGDDNVYDSAALGALARER